MMTFNRSAAVLLFALAKFVASCARTPAAMLPEPSSNMVIDRLSFARDIPSGGTVSDSAWFAFLDEVVTPRFPDGFTVLRGEGQWRYADGRIQREAGFVLEVFHAPGAPSDSTFEAIAREYMRRFRQEAVARTRTPVQQWMYWSIKPH